jgi:hypothetical protein
MTGEEKSRKRLWAVVAVIGLSLGLCLALSVAALGKVRVEWAPVASALDTFMKEMEAKDVESAYALLSPRSQRQSPMTSLEALTQGNSYVLFEGYESLDVQNLNLTATANADPDAPQGTVAEVTATVTYAGGFTGELSAVLEKVDGAWRLFGVSVTVPPNKF